MAKQNQRIRFSDDDLGRIFDDACTLTLAKTAGLPSGADLKQFRSGLIRSAKVFLKYLDRHPPLIRSEMREINHTARQVLARKLDQSVLDALLSDLSLGTKECMERNWRLIQGLGTELDIAMPVEPTAAQAQDMTEHHTRFKRGRMRPSERRSRPTEEPVLWAPRAVAHHPRNNAGRVYVAILRCVYCLAKGKEPARTVNRLQPGPFARLARECLDQLGSNGKNIDVIELINTINRERIAGA